jgi:hypothetical protein
MKFYDIDFINKNWFETILCGLTLDWLVDFKIGDQKVWLMLKRMFKFIFNPTTLKSLNKGEIRIIQSEVVQTTTSISSILKIEVPNLMDYDEVTAYDIGSRLNNLYNNISQVGRVELFYIKRKATVEDYLPYIDWINTNFKKNYYYQPQKNNRDLQLMGLENDTQNFLDANGVGIVDCYMIVSFFTFGSKLSNKTLEESVRKLSQKLSTNIDLLKKSGVFSRLVQNEELHRVMLEYTTGIDTKVELNYSKAKLRSDYENALNLEFDKQL